MRLVGRRSDNNFGEFTWVCTGVPGKGSSGYSISGPTGLVTTVSVVTRFVHERSSSELRLMLTGSRSRLRNTTGSRYLTYITRGDE